MLGGEERESEGWTPVIGWASNERLRIGYLTAYRVYSALMAYFQAAVC